MSEAMSNNRTSNEISSLQEQTKNREHNPRWRGYMCIIFSSLLCFGSIIPEYQDYPLSLSIGIVTFVISLILLIIDYSCFLTADAFNVHTFFDGKFEGVLLIFFALWWIIGVIIITRVGGVAYHASNIYFSSWLSLVTCIYTLNLWSGSKGIISIQELTSLSLTLPGWYVLFLGSLVVLGSIADVYSGLETKDLKSDSVFGLILSGASSVVAGYFILVHYRFISVPKIGGLIELMMAAIILTFWILGLVVLTSESGIAASISNYCKQEIAEISGSNVYIFSWLCFLSCCNIVLRWNSSYAMSFVQAVQRRGESEQDVSGGKDDEENDDFAI